MKPQRFRWTPLAVCLGALGLGAVQAQPPLPAASPALPLRSASGLAFSLGLGEAAKTRGGASTGSNSRRCASHARRAHGADLGQAQRC